MLLCKPRNGVRRNAKHEEEGRMPSKIRPVGDRVVVKPTGGEETAPGGIVIPETAREKLQEGTVVAVGPGKRNEQGTHIPPEVREGDKVIFVKYGGTELVLDGDDVAFLREPDILAIISSA